MDYMELAIKMGELMGLEIALTLLGFNLDATHSQIEHVRQRVANEIERLKDAG